MSNSELACTYACLILHDDGIPITVCVLFSLTSSRILIPTFCWCCRFRIFLLAVILGLFCFEVFGLECGAFLNSRMVFPLIVLVLRSRDCRLFRVSCAYLLFIFTFGPLLPGFILVLLIFLLVSNRSSPGILVLCSWHSECRLVRVLCPFCC